MKMNEFDSVRACFLQLFAHWKEGVYNSAHSKDFLLNLTESFAEADLWPIL